MLKKSNFFLQKKVTFFCKEKLLFLDNLWALTKRRDDIVVDNMVADMEVHMVADMEVDRVADMAAEKKIG